MRPMRSVVLFCALLIAASFTLPSFSQHPTSLKSDSKVIHKPVSEQKASTLDHLQTAFFTESYESQLYLEFAKKADQEGYGQIASMFRAVARAEQIHAAAKESLIQQLGGAPEKSSEPMDVGTTRENLEFALASETYESGEMYSDAEETARKEKQPDAERAFRLSKAAEPGHVAMFHQALNNLEGYKGENIDFYVCPQCGSTARTQKGAACLADATPRNRFENIR